MKTVSELEFELLRHRDVLRRLVEAGEDTIEIHQALANVQSLLARLEFGRQASGPEPRQ